MAGESLPPQLAQVAQKGGATVAAGGGVWIWLAENQQAIAALGVLVGIAVAVAGLIVNWIYLHKRSKPWRVRLKPNIRGAMPPKE